MSKNEKRRLFVDDDNVTLECPCYAGGPDAAQAASGAANIIKPLIDMLMRGEKDQATITLTVEMMTDKQVRELPSI